MQSLLEPQLPGMLGIIFTEERSGPKWAALEASLEMLRALWKQLVLSGFRNLPFLRHGGPVVLSWGERDRLAKASRCTGGFAPWWEDILGNLHDVFRVHAAVFQPAESIALVYNTLYRQPILPCQKHMRN